MLEAITSRDEIRACAHLLENELRTIAPNQARITIGFHGGDFKADVNWGSKIWYGVYPRRSHIFIPFGILYTPHRTHSIIVQINPNASGFNRVRSGLFAKDTRSGKILLLHTGRIGGGKTGISKTTFLAAYQGPRVLVRAPNGKDYEYLKVATLSTRNTAKDVLAYVHEVSAIKDKLSKPKKRKRNSSSKKRGARRTRRKVVRLDTKHLAFKRKNYKKRRRVNRKGAVTVTRTHDAVVNALQLWACQQTGKNTYIYDNQMVDLGAANKRGVTHVFEVKTSTGTQTIYTGVGQLMFHSLANPKIRRTLVIPWPDPELGMEWYEVLDKIGISIIYYKRVRGEYEFQWKEF